MYRCEHCGAIFDTPGSKSYCLEDYNGVGSLFGNRTYGNYDVCPECESENFDPYDIVTYCDVIDRCEECPRYGDDCDGKGEDEEWAD